MPIYKEPLTPTPWVMEDKLNETKILKLQLIFSKAMKNEYRGVQQCLVKNTDYKKPFLYTFDSQKYPGTFYNFANNLEEVIYKANEALEKDKVFGKDYRYDILGNWSYGNIIVMRRSDMGPKDYRDQVKKYNKELMKKLHRIEQLDFDIND